MVTPFGGFKMLRLMIYRMYVKNKNIYKLLIEYIVIFSIILSFVFLLLVIMDNTISAYKDAKYDYWLTYFNEKNLEELSENEYIDDIYTTRIVTGEISSMLFREKSVDIHLVDDWDKKGTSYLGISRKIAGNLEDTGENGIILDALVAKSLHVGVGDTVYIIIKENKVPFRVIMEIEPIVGMKNAVCLYNSYFLDNWNRFYNEEPCYSCAFVKGNNMEKLDAYFYNEYIAPDMEGEDLEYRKEVNISSNIKKEWSLEEAQNGLEYAPPITICVSVLGIIIFFLFVLRESSSNVFFVEKSIAVLKTMGIKERTIITFVCLGQTMTLLPALIIATILVKKVVYDVLITNFYLTWNLCGRIFLIVMLLSIAIAFLIGIILCKKVKKESVYKILREE